MSIPLTRSFSTDREPAIVVVVLLSSLFDLM
jgi:hypothetical protein